MGAMYNKDGGEPRPRMLIHSTGSITVGSGASEDSSASSIAFIEESARRARGFRLAATQERGQAPPATS